MSTTYSVCFVVFSSEAPQITEFLPTRLFHRATQHCINRAFVHKTFKDLPDKQGGRPRQ